MNIVAIQNVFFDDKALLAMGTAFDQACGSLRPLASAKERELIARRIIEAAKKGELDPIRLRSQALLGFSVVDLSMPVVSVGSAAPHRAYARVAHVA